MNIIPLFTTLIKNFKANIHRTTTVIRITNDMTISTYFLSTLWTCIMGLGFALVVGSIGTVVLCAAVLSYEYLFFRLRFKSVLPSATWQQYLEYRENPENYAIETRGGTIRVVEMLNALEEAQAKINPLLGFIQSYCFRKPGLYKVNLSKWSDVINSLNKLGLIKWFALPAKSIGYISLDAFLFAVFQASNFITFRLPVIGSVEILMYELSRSKLLFNLVALLSVVTFVSLFVGSALSGLILTRLGFVGLGTRFGGYASSFSVASITALSVFVGGQFAPPYCRSYAEYLKEVEMVNGQIQIPGAELDNYDVLLYVPSKEIEFVDIPVDPSGIDIPTLGSLEKLEKPDVHPNLRRRGQTKQTKYFREIQEVFEDSDVNPLSCPSDAPIIERMKQSVKTIENEFPLE
jgi:hypothetical protein